MSTKFFSRRTKHLLKQYSGRLSRLKEELAVLDEQMQHFQDIAEEARVKALVAETPMAVTEHTEAAAHLKTAESARQAVLQEMTSLENSINHILDQVDGHYS